MGGGTLNIPYGTFINLGQVFDKNIEARQADSTFSEHPEVSEFQIEERTFIHESQLSSHEAAFCWHTRGAYMGLLWVEGPHTHHREKRVSQSSVPL